MFAGTGLMLRVLSLSGTDTGAGGRRGWVARHVRHAFTVSRAPPSCGALSFLGYGHGPLPSGSSRARRCVSSAPRPAAKRSHSPASRGALSIRPNKTRSGPDRRRLHRPRPTPPPPARSTPIRDGRRQRGSSFSGIRAALTATSLGLSSPQPTSTTWCRTRATALSSGIGRTGRPSATGATAGRRPERFSTGTGGRSKIWAGERKPTPRPFFSRR